jgi:hypothetical protein
MFKIEREKYFEMYVEPTSQDFRTISLHFNCCVGLIILIEPKVSVEPSVIHPEIGYYNLDLSYAPEFFQAILEVTA